MRIEILTASEIDAATEVRPENPSAPVCITPVLYRGATKATVFAVRVTGGDGQKKSMYRIQVDRAGKVTVTSVEMETD